MGSKITVDSDCSHKIKRYLLFGKAMTNLDSVLKRKDITLLIKVHIVKAMVFSGSHVPVWELDHKEIWVPKNWCFWAVVLEKTLKSSLVSKEINLINLKGNQPWILIGKTECWSWSSNTLAKQLCQKSALIIANLFNKERLTTIKEGIIASQGLVSYETILTEWKDLENTFPVYLHDIRNVCYWSDLFTWWHSF